ncbi:MAG TPA: PAS domain S-box protein [Desulfurivibrio alkaliphilus]|uniref:histidine kinase n=1 Tax=Desulfurivibrio alkaliphilus TaxID=427923 RepID=A0A7C2XRZ2_9BACT|nr:PAS domain S-box protein [Desulfurivibrio alkaliphilus]
MSWIYPALLGAAVAALVTTFFCLKRERRRLRRRTEAALYRQLEEFFAIFQAVEGGAYVADMESHEILAITGRNQELFGSNLVGSKCYERAGLGGGRGPCLFCSNRILVNPDGTPARPVVREFRNPADNHWYLCIDRAIHWPDGRLVRLEIAINITARKQAEENLRRSEHNFRELVENSLVGILLVQDGEIVYQNPEQRRLLGNMPNSLLLKDFTAIHPEDLAKVRESYRKINSGVVAQADLEFRLYSGGRRREGELVWVYCRARPIDFQGRKTMLISMVDISQAKELERLVRVQDKMSSLGRVAAGMAHEIRNPLSGINIYLGTLQRMYDRPEMRARVEEIFQRLMAASAKIEAVIQRVIDFAKPGQLQVRALDPNQPVAAALELATVILERHGIVPELEAAAELPLCRIDRQQIEQVLLNLLTNSAEAMEQLPPGARRLLRVRTLMAEGMVEIRVDDSGPGIPAGVRERILDPFYTTKGDGTGIGLNISHRIISDHGGRLEVAKSDLGGARFRVMLPPESGMRKT